MLRAFLMIGRSCCVVAALFALEQGRGGAGAAEPEPRLDLYGDPLPTDARVRLGTVRFRHDSDLYCVAYSPDGSLIASCGMSTSICLWNAETGKLVRKFSPGHDLIRAVVFSPDGERLLSVGRNHPGPQLHLWEVATGEVKQTFTLGGSDHDPYTAAYSPTGKLVAAGDVRGGVYVWDVETGQRQVFEQTEHSLQCVEFSPEGDYLAAGLTDGMVYVRQLDDSQTERTFKAHGESVDSITFTPDGEWLITSGHAAQRFGRNRAIWKGDVQVWNAKTLERNVKSKIDELSHGPGLAVSRNGKTLALAGQRDVSLWDWPRMVKIGTLEGYQNTFGFDDSRLSFSPDGSSLAAACGSNCCAVKLWDLESKKQRFYVEAHDSEITSVRCLADGKLITCSDDRSARLWNANTAECLQTLNRNVLAVSADGRWLVSNDGVPVIRRDSLLRVVDAATQQTVDSLKIGERFVSSCVYSEDGRFLAVSTYDYLPDNHEHDRVDQTVRIWRTDIGEELAEISAHNFEARFLFFLPNGKQVMMLGMRGEAAIWDQEGQQIVRAFDAVPMRGGVHAATLSPDGATLGIVSSFGNVIRLIDVADGKVLREIPSGDARIGLTYSPDGRMLAAAESRWGSFSKKGPRAVQIWDAATGDKLGSLSAADTYVSTLAFSLDSSELITGMQDGSCLIWKLSSIRPSKAQVGQ